MSGVENSTYVGGLNQLNPESQDFISQGDDHLKLIKKCLLNTFPGFSRPIDGALFPWSQTPGAISVYAKFIEHTGRIGALEAFISPLHPDGAILRANNNLSDVADPAVARANLGIPAIADVLIKSQNLNDVPDKAAARINLGVPASADVLVKTQNLIDLQDVAIARQNLDVFSKAETFQKNLNLSDVVSAAVARTNLGAAAQADVLLKAQNFADVPDKAVARFNLDVPSNGDLAAAITSALVGLSAVTSVNGLIGDVVLDSADVGADPAGSATTAVNAHLVDADPHPQYTTVAEAAAAAPVQSVNGMTGAVTLEEEVLQYANLAAFPVSGSGATLYIAADTGLVYRWDGAAYVATGLQPIANQTILGNVSGATATPTALNKTQVREFVGQKVQIAANPVAGSTVTLNADVGTLHITGPYLTSLTLDCTNLADGAAVSVYCQNGIGTVTYTGGGLNYEAGGAPSWVANATKTLARNGTRVGIGTALSPDMLELFSVSGINASVPVRGWQVRTNVANCDFVVSPKGSGAILAQLPDATTAGGNKRGQYAVDLQTERTAATQVASGVNSVISGGKSNATAAGATYSVVAGGNSNSIFASGEYATIGGGTANQVHANRATVCGGAYNTSSGADSTTSGGGNTASGTSAVAMGSGCVASGAFASIALGQGSTASAITAVAIGGTVIADGNYSTALGQYSQTFGVSGAIAHSSGRVTTTGDVQTRSVTLFTQTTNATPSVLRTTTSAVSSSNILNNRDYTLQVIKGRCIARTPGSTVDYAVWEFTALLNRGADAASSALLILLVTPALLASGGTGGTWGLSVTADTTNGGLLVTGTGEAGKTITWGCDLNALEVQDLS